MANQSVSVPPLRRPNEQTADPGKVRVGDTGITTDFPVLRRPDRKTADRGKVRVGDTGIVASFPLMG